MGRTAIFAVILLFLVMVMIQTMRQVRDELRQLRKLLLSKQPPNDSQSQNQGNPNEQ